MMQKYKRLGLVLAYLLVFMLIIQPVFPLFGNTVGTIDARIARVYAENLDVHAETDGDLMGENQAGSDDFSDDVAEDNDSGDDAAEDSDSGDDAAEDSDSGDDAAEDNDSGDDAAEDNDSGDDAAVDNDSCDDATEDSDSGDDAAEDNDSGDDAAEDNDSGDNAAEDSDSGDDAAEDNDSGDDAAEDNDLGDDVAEDCDSGEDIAEDNGSGDETEIDESADDNEQAEENDTAPEDEIEVDGIEMLEDEDADVFYDTEEFDAVSSVITWEITVNTKRMLLRDVTVNNLILDDMAGMSHEFFKLVPGSFTLDGVVQPDPTLYENGGETVLYLGDIADCVASFKMVTKITDAAFLGNNASGMFINRVMVHGVNRFGLTAMGSAEAEANCESCVLSMTAGAFDPETRRLPWSVTVNEDQLALLEDVRLTFTIPNGFEPVWDADGVTADSVSLNAMSKTADAIIVDAGDINGRTVTLTFDTEMVDWTVMAGGLADITATVSMTSCYDAVPVVTKAAAAIEPMMMNLMIEPFAAVMDIAERITSTTLQIYDNSKGDYRDLSLKGETLYLSEKFYIRLDLKDYSQADLQEMLLNGGCTYEITLPANVVAVDGHIDELYDSEGSLIAKLTVKSSNKAVYTIPYGEGSFLENNAGSINDPRSGFTLNDLFVWIECELDQTTIQSAESIELNFFALKGGQYQILIGDNIPAPPSVQKRLLRYDPTTNLFEWSVSIRNVTKKLGDILFTDDLGPFQTYQTGTFIISSDSTVADPTKIEAGIMTYTISASDAGTVNLSYKTRLSAAALFDTNGKPKLGDTNTVIVQNNAKITWVADPGSEATDSFTYKDVETSFLQKNGVFIFGTNEIEWTVKINTYGQNLSNLYLYDEAGDGTAHILETLTVNRKPYAAFNSQQQAACRIDPLDSLMTLQLTNNTGSGVFDNNSIITITYRTSVDVEGYFYDEMAGGEQEFTNKAWLSFDWNNTYGDGPGIGSYNTKDPGIGKGTVAVIAPVRKWVDSYDQTTGIITWCVEVNANQLNMKEATITDTPDGTGINAHTYLGYVENSLSGNPNGTIGVTHNTTDKTVTLTNIGTSTVRYKVKTQVTRDFLASYEEGTFINKVELAGTAIVVANGVADEKPIYGSTSAEYKRVSKILSKSVGKYDYKEKTIEWTITVNGDALSDFESATVTDVLSGNQDYIGDSLKMTGINKIDPTQSGNTLTWALSGINNKIVIITYKTKLKSVDDNYMKEEFDLQNTVSMTGYYNFTPTCVSSTKIEFTPLTKDVNVSRIGKDYVFEYFVYINQFNDALKANLTLTDKLRDDSQGNVQLDVDSVKLHQAIIAQDGSFSYETANEITINPPDQTGSQFSVTIPAGNGACVLVYSCIARAYAGTTLTNTISFGTGGGLVSNVNNADLSGNLGMGGITKYYSYVPIEKRDSKTNALVAEAGVEFKLYRYTNNSPVPDNYQPVDGELEYISTTETDAEGKAVFYLLAPSDVEAGRYFVKETIAPNGYELSSVYQQVKKVSLAETKCETLKFINNRKKYAFSFEKLGEIIGGTAEQLEGVEFTLTDQESGGNYKEGNNGVVPLISDVNGMVSIIGNPNITWGKYTLVETLAPSKYVPNMAAYNVTITPNNDDSTCSVFINSPYVDNNTTPHTFTNIKGSVTINIVDALDKKNILPGGNFTGAEFTLTKVDPLTGDAIIGTKVTDGSGKLTFNNLDYEATYKLQSTTAPTGYLNNLGIITFKVKNGDSLNGVTVTNWLNTQQVMVEYTRTGVYSFSFEKLGTRLDANGTPTTYSANPNEVSFELESMDDTTFAKQSAVVGAGGVVAFTSLPFGRYKLIQNDPMTGHVPHSDVITFTLERSVPGHVHAKVDHPIPDYQGSNVNVLNVDASDNPLDLSFQWIDLKAAYTLTKTDNLYTNTPVSNLEGAQFKIDPPRTGLPEGSSDIVVIGANGKVEIEYLDFGKEYVLNEITSPKGYTSGAIGSIKITGDASSGTGSIGNNRAAIYGFSFTALSDILNDAVNNETEAKKLQGAEFRLAYKDTPTGSQKDNVQLPANQTSGADGRVNFAELTYGTYVVKQTVAPAGYFIKENANGTDFEFDVKIEQNGDVVIGGVTYVKNAVGTVQTGYNVENERGTYTLTVEDKDYPGTKLSGVQFEFSVEGGSVFTLTTDAYGQIILKGLLRDTIYKLVQISTLEDYLLPDEANRTITIQLTGRGKALSGVVENRRKSHKVGFKTDDGHGNWLAGVKFDIYDNDNPNSEPLDIHPDGVSSDDNGDVWFTGLKDGTYYIRVQQSQNLKGYRFNTVMLTVVVDQEGLYTIKAQNAEPPINADPSAVNGRNQISGVVVSHALLGSVTIVLHDAEDSLLIEGAEFTVSTSSNGAAPIDTKTTDAGGRVIFEGLELDTTYYIHKLVAAEGYNLADYNGNATVLAVKLKYENTNPGITAIPTDNSDGDPEFMKSVAYDNHDVNATVTLTGFRAPVYTFHLCSVDAFGGYLPNVTFTLFRNNIELTQANSALNGDIAFTGLCFGTYTVSVTDLPYGYASNASQFNLHILPDGSYTLTDANGQILGSSSNNAPIPIMNRQGALTVTAVDQIDNSITLRNISLALYGDDDPNHSVEEGVTDQNGELTFIKLLVDKTYYIKVLDTADHYALNTQPIGLFTPTADNLDITMVVELAREPEYALYVKHTDTSSAVVQNVETALRLAANNGLVDTQASNTGGMIRFESLPFGTYYVKSLSGPETHVINTASYTVNISKEGVVTSANGSLQSGVLVIQHQQTAEPPVQPVQPEPPVPPVQPEPPVPPVQPEPPVQPVQPEPPVPPVQPEPPLPPVQPEPQPTAAPTGNPSVSPQQNMRSGNIGTAAVRDDQPEPEDVPSANEMPSADEIPSVDEMPSTDEMQGIESPDSFALDNEVDQDSLADEAEIFLELFSSVEYDPDTGYETVIYYGNEIHEVLLTNPKPELFPEGRVFMPIDGLPGFFVELDENNNVIAYYKMILNPDGTVSFVWLDDSEIPYGARSFIPSQNNSSSLIRNAPKTGDSSVDRTVLLALALLSLLGFGIAAFYKRNMNTNAKRP